LLQHNLRGRDHTIDRQTRGKIIIVLVFLFLSFLEHYHRKENQILPLILDIHLDEEKHLYNELYGFYARKFE
jgi:hypothetical protein